jgi:O-methyltransferase involved in polyketide biosynthesis
VNGDPRHGAAPPVVDVSVPANARVWDYWLGGKDNFEVDRKVGDAVAQMHPLIPVIARADRAFLRRVVTFLAGECGIRQFLDVGTGLPAANNTHEVAQRVAPDARVVYVDHDRSVLAHARALLAGTPEGRTAYVDADAHHPEVILEHAGRTLDFREPTALLMLGLLNFIPDDDAASRTVSTLVDRLAPGSYVAITHPTVELNGEGNVAAMRFWNEQTRQPIVARSRTQVSRFLDGLELLEPGLVSCTHWRPDADDAHLQTFRDAVRADPRFAPAEGELVTLPQWGAVARKP